MKILFVTANRIGDAVLSSGVLAHLQRENPAARVTIACGAPAAPLFDAVPGVERIIVLEKRPAHLHWLALWAASAATRWDVVADLRGSALAWFLAARRRILPRGGDPAAHRVAELGQSLGLDPPPPPVLWVPDAAEARARDLLGAAGAPLLAVGPTANWGGKQWPADRFAALISRATAADGILPGARVVVLGAAAERAQAAPLIDALGPERVTDLMGEPLMVGAAAISRAALYVGNDSGLMHIAAASRTPTLGLFGPSPDSRYAPWGAHCAVVRTEESYEDLVHDPGFDHRRHDSLMGGLSVDRAYEALASLYTNVKYRAAQERT